MHNSCHGNSSRLQVHVAPCASSALNTGTRLVLVGASMFTSDAHLHADETLVTMWYPGLGGLGYGVCFPGSGILRDILLCPLVCIAACTCRPRLLCLD